MKFQPVVGAAPLMCGICGSFWFSLVFRMCLACAFCVHVHVSISGSFDLRYASVLVSFLWCYTLSQHDWNSVLTIMQVDDVGKKREQTAALPSFVL